MQKIMLSIAGLGLSTLLLVPVADAQLFLYGISTTPPVVATSATTTAITSSTVAPFLSAIAPITLGFIQFNNLVVESVSSSTSMLTVTSGTIPLATCESFETEFSATGVAMACPTTTADSYQIQVNATTQLLLSDRSPGMFTNFTPGDNISVFGYYDGEDNTIQAYVLRDLSQPTSTTVSVSELQTEISQIQLAINEIMQEVNQLVASSTI